MFEIARSLWKPRQETRRRHRVRPLVALEGLERPPDDLLRRLRAITPTLELIGIGEGIWWLGRVEWNRDRYTKSVSLLKGSLAIEKNRWVRLQAKLAIRGFGKISEWQATPNSRILLDWQRKDWKERHNLLDAEFEDRLLESDGTMDTLRRKRLLRDKNYSENRDIARHAFRHPVSIVKPERVVICR